MTPADSDTEYAYWTAPGERFTVTYSLPVFHEIEFQVSEGFRRIPHGGVETGGLLFGRLGQGSARIEAFRPIECEHASGPSFQLSERDVAALRDQLVAAAADAELRGLDVLGWFIAHTRSPLEMNDREAAIFNEFFPEPGRIQLLIKPERFQATRYAFLVRGPDGSLDRHGAPNAFILPLPGRTVRSARGPAASIPAPVQSEAPVAAPTPHVARPVSPEPVPEPEPAGVPAPPPAPPAKEERQAADASFWREVPAQSTRREPVVRIEEPPAAAETAAIPEPAAPAVPLTPIEDIKQRRAENLQPAKPEGTGRREQKITRKMRHDGKLPVVQLVLLLLLAAALGCAAGYFAYLQLPSATVDLTVEPQRAPASQNGVPGLVVSWPAEQTRDAIFASIRVDDGEATPLTTQQKADGRALVPMRSDNVKIELIAQRRWRDSRGIVRYVRAQSVSPITAH